MDYIKQLQKDINKNRYSYLTLLDSNFYEIQKALKNRSDEDIHLISDWIDESIDDYFNYEMEEGILSAEMAVKDGIYKLEDFFEPQCNIKDSWYDPFLCPRKEEIIIEFCVDTPSNTDDNTVIQNVLNYFYGYEIDTLEEVKDYEVMAVMALKHIKSALDNSDTKLQKEIAEDMGMDKFNLIEDWSYIAEQQAIKDSINACLAVNSLLSMKHSEEMALKLKQKENDILKDRASKGGKARHRATNKIKEIVLSEYKLEYLRYKEMNKVLSKNDFARRAEEKYNVAFLTIRNNWLKGYNPKF